METNYIDKIGNTNAKELRHLFYHYHYDGSKKDKRAKKFFKFIQNFSRYYRYSFHESGKTVTLQLLRLDNGYVEAIIDDEVPVPTEEESIASTMKKEVKGVSRYTEL